MSCRRWIFHLLSIDHSPARRAGSFCPCPWIACRASRCCRSPFADVSPPFCRSRAPGNWRRCSSDRCTAAFPRWPSAGWPTSCRRWLLSFWMMMMAMYLLSFLCRGSFCQTVLYESDATDSSTGSTEAQNGKQN